MNIDQAAPAIAQDEITINAPIEKVWEIQTNIGNWSIWQPDIKRIEIQGDIVPGTTFLWKAQGLTIQSTLEVVEPYRQIGWTGTAMGMKARHIFYFDALPEGTHVKVEESLSGWFTRLLCLFDRHFLQKSMAKSLAILKEHVEKSV